MPDAARLLADTADGITRVRFPQNRFDGIAVRELFELAMALTDAPRPKLLVDLTGLPMVPSGGVGILISIRKKFLQHGGQLHLASPDPLVTQSFEVMNVHRLLQIFPTPEQALAAFKK